MSLAGIYNGLHFGPGGDVAVADAVGLEAMPSLRSTRTARAAGDGGLPGTVYVDPRIIAFEWLIIGDDPADFNARRTNVVRRCGIQRDVELPLVITSSQRQLYVRPTKLSVPRELYHHQRTGSAFVEFVAETDPWWQDVGDITADFRTGAPATFFPFFPLRLSSSEVFADAQVVNDGDVEAWPVWVITGPGSGVVLRNLTTGTMLSVAVNLAAGESLTVDTRPGHKTVTANDGSNAFNLVGATSSLWSLLVGTNSIRIELGAATSSSVVSLRYKRRWFEPGESSTDDIDGGYAPPVMSGDIDGGGA